MKANEAPEKIYVHKSKYWGLMANVQNITKNGIEYTRTDAFIEKACKWLRNNSHNYANNALGIEYLINDFKDYMKGE